MSAQAILWLAFAGIIAMFMVVDLGYFNRTAHKVSTRSAVIQTIFWVAVALVFASAIFLTIGHAQAADFLSAYVTEKMLSIDNLFVILLIFTFFKLQETYYHRVLFWGIIGVVILRGAFIGAGAAVIENFHWVLYIFGAFLVYSGVKLLFKTDDDEVDIEHNKVLKLARKYLRLDTEERTHFMVRRNGKLHFTMLFVILLLVETTDIVFAFDSIPAVFSITQDPFIVFTSNIFAVMGLRAMFFLVEKIMAKLVYLQQGLSFVLVFIGAKMFGDLVNIHISSLTSFAIIVGILVLSTIASLASPKAV